MFYNMFDIISGNKIHFFYMNGKNLYYFSIQHEIQSTFGNKFLSKRCTHSIIPRSSIITGSILQTSGELCLSSFSPRSIGTREAFNSMHFRPILNGVAIPWYLELCLSKNLKKCLKKFKISIFIALDYLPKTRTVLKQIPRPSSSRV